MNRTRRLATRTGPLVVLAGALAALVLWQLNGAQATADLFAAIRRDDVPSAIRALDRGADANARFEQEPPSIWEQTEDIFRGRSPHPYARTPLLVLLDIYRQGDCPDRRRIVHRSERGISGAQSRVHALVKILIEHGADVNAADSLGNTPLIYALEDREAAAVRSLVARGAVVTAGAKGHSPLITAIDFGNDIDIVDLLLDRGASANASSGNGADRDVPINLAVMRFDGPMVRTLLNHRANPNVRSEFATRDLRLGPMRPLRFVRLQGMREIEAMLSKAGAIE